MKKTWKPTVAGVLGILSAVSYFIPLMMCFLIPEGAPLEQWEYAGMLGFAIIFYSPSVLLAVVAGICALVRSAWLLALVCLIIFSLVQMLSAALTRLISNSFGILASIIGVIIPLAAVVLLLLSRAEFRHGKAGEGEEAGHKPRCEICGKEFRKHEMAYPDTINGKDYTSVHWECLSEETRKWLWLTRGG
jgi:hypothetical protein